jgi:hypothetical protein
MDVKDALRFARENRLVRDRSEVKRFEEALGSLGGVRDEDTVRQLYLLFDDGCRHEEVVWGLVPVFVDVVPEMERHASEWIHTLLYRLLNVPEARDLLVAEVKKARAEAGKAVRGFLREIAKDEEKSLAANAQAAVDALASAD